jgi:hypothetical protein
MKIPYKTFQFRESTLAVIAQAQAILAEYAQRGIVVTLRQLYYQFVARDLIRNKQSEYDRLGSIVNDARLAGLIDWDYLQDRTRNLNKLPHWDDPAGVIASAASSYHRNLWDGQLNYVEVWIEKDALIGVIEAICEEWDVPYFSCRGYTSQSEMWGASQRLLAHQRQGKFCHVIHLGDHDPSGKDMSRDIESRLTDFLTYHLIRDFMKGKALMPEGERREHQFELIEQAVSPMLPRVHRIALNMDQVRQYNPPPNPAKITDSRATAYIAEFGGESWELDALDPDVLVALVRDNILALLDRERWETERDRQESERALLNATSDNWPDVQRFVEGMA